MGFYDRHILPHLIHIACGTPPIKERRRLVVPFAKGRVLEIGMGSGHNLIHYDQDQVEMIWGLEPSLGMRKKAAGNVAASSFEVTWLDLPSETIPLESNSADTVVLTFTLCTIPDWQVALDEMRRVLKPGGQLLFCEHGVAPDENVRRWQDRLNPFWQKMAGGCQLNRAIPTLIEAGGFRIDSLDTGYVRGGPRFAGFTYWGNATPR